MPGIIVIGSQWGDEGKGKIVDYFSKNASKIVRYQGGNNAGHTVVIGEKVYKLHLIPSGALHGKRCLIGPGVVLNPEVLLDELNELGMQVDLGIDPRTHIILPYHCQLDELRESQKGNNKIGTTKRGIGPCYQDKAKRIGIRFFDLIDKQRLEQKLKIAYEENRKIIEQIHGEKMQQSFEELLQSYSALGEKLKHTLCDTSLELDHALEKQETVLFEGAQGTFLDIDFGTYPFVTTSNPTVGGAFTGTGVGISRIEKIIAIVKAYTTRVGAGPFVTELSGDMEHRLREAGKEYGATTGRPRRVGWLDLVQLKASKRFNSFTEIALTKLDVLQEFEKIQVCTAYTKEGNKTLHYPATIEEMEKCTPILKEFSGFKLTGTEKEYNDLPLEARTYIEFIEQYLSLPVKIVSLGPERTQTIMRN